MIAFLLVLVMAGVFAWVFAVYLTAPAPARPRRPPVCAVCRNAIDSRDHRGRQTEPKHVCGSCLERFFVEEAE